MNTTALVLNANVVFIHSLGRQLMVFSKIQCRAGESNKLLGSELGGGVKLHFLFCGCLCYL